MEENGAGPILFHLRCLTHEAEFWPLIEREIESRSFFLLCESAAARSSEWVKRERAAVARARQSRPIRIGYVDVDGPDVDFEIVRRFLRHLNVHLVYPENRHADFSVVERAAKEARFRMSGWGTTPSRLDALRENDWAWDDFSEMLRVSTLNGWLLLVLDNALASSALFRAILPRPIYRPRCMVILTETITEPLDWLKVEAFQRVDGSDSLTQAATTAIARMLTTGP
jgi:hypothetical protein